MTPPKRLYEIDHPYYGPDDGGDKTTDFEGFVELWGAVEDLDPDMNHVYRWDWNDWSQPHYDDLFGEDESDRSGQQLVLYLVLPRKSMLLCFRCPVTHDQEPEVRAWLAGPRILGALRALWEPLLDTADASRG